MSESTIKCAICNGDKTGEFITIKDRKYHIDCIEKIVYNYNRARDYIRDKIQKSFMYDWGIDEEHNPDDYLTTDAAIEIQIVDYILREGHTPREGDSNE